MEEVKKPKKKAKEKQDIDKILLLLSVIEPVGVNLKKALADGRIDFKDGMYGYALLQELPKLVAAFKGIAEAYDESKDIDANEALEIVKKLYEIGKKIEQA